MRRLYSAGDLRRCLLICLVVGTLLAMINQGGLAARALADFVVAARVGLNDLVPFSVASVSAGAYAPRPSIAFGRSWRARQRRHRVARGALRA